MTLCYLYKHCFGIVSTTYKNMCWLSSWAKILKICDEVRQRKNTDVFKKILFVLVYGFAFFLIDRKNITHWPTVQ